MATEVYDITIIGGGPAGLFGSFYAGLRDARTKIIEATGELGGALVHEYPNEVLRNVAGYVVITAKSLAEKFIEQALVYEHKVCLNEKAVDLSFNEKDKVWTVKTDKGEHKSLAVVLALGTLENLKKKHKQLADNLAKLGLKLTDEGIAVDANMASNKPGLFVCGDSVAKSKELNFITIASAEAAIAVNNAKKYISPGADAFPGYSTDLRKEKPNYRTNPMAD